MTPCVNSHAFMSNKPSFTVPRVNEDLIRTEPPLLPRVGGWLLTAQSMQGEEAQPKALPTHLHSFQAESWREFFGML